MTSRVIWSTLSTWHNISSSLTEWMDTLIIRELGNSLWFFCMIRTGLRVKKRRSAMWLIHSSFWTLLHLSLSLFSSLLFSSQADPIASHLLSLFNSLLFPSLSLLSIPLVSSISIFSLLSTRDFPSISHLISIPSGVTLFIHFYPLFPYSTEIRSYWSTLDPILSIRSNYFLSRNAFHSFDRFVQLSRLE